MNKPLVSLILVSYNHSAFIDDSIQAVINLTYDNLEIIYMDDASKDDTYEKALIYQEKLKARYTSVTMMKNDTNQGIVKNLNRCLAMAHGKYIKILATDDFLLKDSIGVMVDVLENNQSIDVIYSNTLPVSENDRYEAFSNHSISDIDVKVVDDKQPFERIYDKDDIAAPTLMMRSSLIDKIGYYDEAISTEDWDFLLRASRVTDFIHICMPLIAYRYVENSFSHSASPAKRIMMKKSELQIIEKHGDVARNSGIDVEHKQSIAFNEAFADAFYIKNKEYIGYLREYAKRNHIRYSSKNKIKNLILALPYKEK